MIRFVILCVALAAPVAADQRASYWRALEVASTELRREHAESPTITYDVDALASEGTLVRWVGETSQVTAPDLVAVYDHTTRTCHWGFDSDVYPALARSAALMVQTEAAASNWPEDAIAPLQGRPGDCITRSALGTTVGRLDYIDMLRFGDLTLYLGFTDAEGTS